MIALSIALVLCVLLVCSAWTHVLEDKHALIRERREWKDNVSLGARLEKELVDIQELKTRVESLTLKAGFNR